jgi:3-methyladenine DNA glycosylase AlkC
MAQDPLNERKLFKHWFDESAAQALARQFTEVYPEFDGKRFVELASKGLEELEFKARVLQFANAMGQTLPSDRACALGVLVDSLERLPDCEAPMDGWMQWPLGEFIGTYGLDHFDQALHAMTVLTQKFSSEFAVRPFLQRYPEQTFSALCSLCRHPSSHVRRWCSEGIRPRLPWGGVLKSLVNDPSPIWPILEALKDDPEPYVRRSVANNLNDIAKDHPDLVLERCRVWSEDSNPDRDGLIKHGLRSLIKNAHPGALALMGFEPPRELDVEVLLSSQQIRLGDSVTLTAKLANKAGISQALQLDYVVEYVRQKGKTSQKVFKWKSLHLGPGQTQVLAKKHAMKVTSTRALYPGLHKVELQVNGQRMAESHFELITPHSRFP